MPEAARELEATKGKPKWAWVLAGVLASWVEDKTENVIESEYECAMELLSHVWSHIPFEVEKEEVGHVTEVKNHGGHFLVKDHGPWTLVRDVVVNGGPMGGLASHTIDA